MGRLGRNSFVLLPLSSIGIEVCMQQAFSKVEQSFDCFSCCKTHQKHSTRMIEHAIWLSQHHHSNSSWIDIGGAFGLVMASSWFLDGEYR
ncbi:hypothetical protein LOK49_LG03G00870 [Camellia lanceoleosa]|uniref:Uncharacterized protein n=1 Tax=Camellia lanceoleosa TaxID=1840588 RepID=A0ACC0IE20_9ERIC|nr:hypothetical protein LOK49_LG03G00870 [Camellia lanceoleosa]